MNLSISGVPADWLVPRVLFFPFLETGSSVAGSHTLLSPVSGG